MSDTVSITLVVRLCVLLATRLSLPRKYNRISTHSARNTNCRMGGWGGRMGLRGGCKGRD